jgi:hypothetical protein
VYKQTEVMDKLFSYLLERRDGEVEGGRRGDIMG